MVCSRAVLCVEGHDAFTGMRTGGMSSFERARLGARVAEHGVQCTGTAVGEEQKHIRCASRGVGRQPIWFPSCLHTI